MKSFQFMENMCTIRLKENATNFKESLKNTVDCQQQIINDFLQEMNPNIQNEQEIIRKACSFEKHIMKCNENINREIQRCLIGQERDVMNITLKTMRAAVDYVCYNDGERIALFLDNDGWECVLSQMNNIYTCVREKLASVESLALEELSSIGFSDDVCKIVNDIPHCVVEYTGKCNDSTPSDILDSLHKHILKMTPCWQGNSAPTQLFHSSYLLVHLLTLVTAALFAANILV
ncbi:27 kDa hemolymph glycoprotein-like isoform X2 [Panulirus ornatus]